MKIIELEPRGQGTTSVDLEDAIVTFVTRYNYSANCWTLDLIDAEDNPILMGLMLIPNIDVLIPYAEQKELYGSLVLVEKETDDYQDPDRLGVDTKLIWYAPGEEINILT